MWLVNKILTHADFVFMVRYGEFCWEVVTILILTDWIISAKRHFFGGNNNLDFRGCYLLYLILTNLLQALQT